MNPPVAWSVNLRCRQAGCGGPGGVKPVKRVGMFFILILVGGFFPLELCARGQEPSRSPVPDGLTRRVEAVLTTSGFQNGHWGILVVDRKSGEVVYERNADQLFAPASVTKLFSTAAALIELGPGYRFQTPLVRHGEVDSKGKLQGEVVLIAQGDLCMGGRTGPEGTLLFKDEDHTYSGGNLRSEVVGTNPLAGLDHLAREVEAAGIHEIAGEVIVDDRLFAPAFSSGSGPSRVSPIVINDNVIDILARPAGKAGEAGHGHDFTGDPVCDDRRGGRDGRIGQAGCAFGRAGRATEVFDSWPVAGGPSPGREDRRDRAASLVCAGTFD